jgi:hypothetical protein
MILALLSILSVATWLSGLSDFLGTLVTPFIIAFFILVYELMLKFDIGSTVSGALNLIYKAYVRKPGQNLSILPSSTPLDADTQAQIFRIDHPFNMYIYLNRGFLYVAFFLSLTAIWPFNVFAFTPQVFVEIFSVINTVITVYEPLFLFVIITIASVDRVSSVVGDIVKLVS